MSEPPNPEVAVFAAALELPADQRGAYLDQACAGDADLRRQVEALLRVHDDAGSFFDNLAPATRPTSREDAILVEKPGDWIGRYKLLQQIGEGGCGVVYMAEQEEPVRRRVALKVIKLGMDTKSVVARFEAERQALALMDHSNIAKVLDAGATETGRPYFVMELVRGVKITDYCDQNNLSTGERLDLFIQVCRAIQHAHQKGITHRDIKPSNILVTMNDGVPLPKVIDFGIAKATQGKLTDQTLFTAFEQFIGTPAYMSPEQAEMSAKDIDTRSDIYSLGVLLYELLTGQTPFDAKELLQAGLDEIRRTIREKEPAHPSTRLSTMLGAHLTAIAKHRNVEPPRLIHLVRGDLDWIVMKALEKDRTRRYETANGLALDIERHLKNEPVVARPPSDLYRFRKLVRRNKLAFGAIGAVTGALVIGLGLSTWMFVQEKRANEQTTKAEREQSRLRQDADEARALETTMRHLAERREIAVRRNGYVSDLVAANLALDDGNFGLARSLIAQQQPEPGQEDLRSFDWRYLWSKSRGEQLKTLIGHSNYVNCIAYAPDGAVLASGSSDDSVKLWNAKTGELLANCLGNSAPVVSVAFCPSGEFFASGSEDGVVRLWNARTHQVVFTLTNAWPLLAFSREYLAIASGGNQYAEGGGPVSLWNYRTREPALSLPESGNRAAFSPDGRIMATANWNGLIKLWNVEEGKLLRSFSCTNIIALAFSPDGGSLACCTIHGEVELWDLGKDQPSIFPTSAGRSFDLAFSPDGQILAIANQSHDISLWDVTRQQLVQTLAGHAKEVTAVAFSPDGKSLASGSQDDAVMLWNPSGRAERASITNVAIPDYEKVGVPVFSRDGRHLAAGTLDDGMIVLETESGEVNLRGAIHGLPVAFSDDDKSLLTHEDGSSAYVDWDLATGSILASNQLANRMTHILDSTFSPDGKTIAFSRGGGQIVMMNAVTGGFLFALSVPSDARCLAFSPDGQMLGTGSFDGIARLWDLRQRRVVWTVAGFRDTVAAVVFCTNGVFAAGSWDGSIKICDPVAQKELATLIGHKAGIKKLAFASDGRTLASGADDCTVKLWNLAIGREVLSFKTEVPQYFVTFSPDDKFLVTGGRDGVVHFWRAPSFSAIAAAENSGKP